MFVAKKEFNGALYTGAPAIFAGKGVASLLDDKWYEGRLVWHPTACVLTSDDDVGKKIESTACTFGDNHANIRRFLVIGSSFSAAEFEMYSALGESGRGTVTATSSWGASPVLEVPNLSPRPKANDYYWNNVIPNLVSNLRQGDFLIMINDLAGLVPARMYGSNLERLTLLNKGLERLSKELQARGVEIVFQMQSFLILEARCTPDMAKAQWFHIERLSPCSYYNKDYITQRLKPLRDVLDAVEQNNVNFHVLDLLPLFCADSLCRFDDRHGVLLFRDEWSHPSIAASYLARPAFLSVVDRAIRASKAQSVQRF